MNIFLCRTKTFFLAQYNIYSFCSLRLETRKSFALSENLPQVDEISRSSLNIQDETSKRSTINNLVDSDL